MVLVTALNGASIHYQNEVGNLIQECLALSSTFEAVQFVYVLRKNNVIADVITRWTIHAMEKCEWNEEMPVSFQEALAQDSI